jgi:hypothetical protein
MARAARAMIVSILSMVSILLLALKHDFGDD